MATALKMDIPAVTAAIENKDEVALPAPISPDLKVFLPAELATRDESIKNTHTKAGMEIAIKQLKEDAGLTYDGEGSKDPKKFVTEIRKKTLADAGVDEGKKVTELNATIDGLRANIVKIQGEATERDAAFRQAKHDQTILSSTIDLKPDIYAPDEWVGLMKVAGVSLEEKDGVTVVKRGGEVVVDKTTLKALPVKDALVGIVNEKKWGKVKDDPITPGRGASDSKKLDGIQNMKEFNAHLESQGIHLGSQQASSMLTEITTANKNFDFSTK